VDGGLADDRLIVTGAPGTDMLRVTWPATSDIRVARLGTSGESGYVRATDIEGLYLDVGPGAADEVQIEGSSGNDTLTLVGVNDAVEIRPSAPADEYNAAKINMNKVNLGGMSSSLYLVGMDRGQGDVMKVFGLGGDDTIDANGVTNDLAVLYLFGGADNDTLVGSEFNDHLDGGTGDDRITGGLGLDTFADESGMDTLVEDQDADMSLFNDTFIVGSLLGGTTAPTHDRYAAGAVVESLGGLFEHAELTAGGTLVVNDVDSTVYIGGAARGVVQWIGRADLNNSSATGKYVASITAGNPAHIVITDTTSPGGDQLIVYGSSVGDLLTLDVDEATGYSSIAASGASSTYVEHTGVEDVQILTFDGPDRLAVRAIAVDNTILAGGGDDWISVGSQATIALNTATGNYEVPTTGSLADRIGAVLTVDAANDAARDRLDVDDSGDATDNVGVLTATDITGLGMCGRFTTSASRF
jgi:Ca2+-binding RTX toxin-like protein